jgi:hypothetical protein
MPRAGHSFRQGAARANLKGREAPRWPHHGPHGEKVDAQPGTSRPRTPSQLRTSPQSSTKAASAAEAAALYGKKKSTRTKPPLISSSHWLSRQRAPSTTPDKTSVSELRTHAKLPSSSNAFLLHFSASMRSVFTYSFSSSDASMHQPTEAHLDNRYYTHICINL